MERFRRDWWRILLAHVCAFAFSWVMVTYVFLGPLPRVRPSLKDDIRSAPSALVQSTKNIKQSLANVTFPTLFTRTSSSDMSDASQSPPGDSTAPEQHELVSPWVFRGDPNPTAVPPTSPPQPTQAEPLPTTAPGQPTRVPTLFQRPTSPPQPTQRPQPTALPPTAVPDLNAIEGEVIAELNRRRVAAGLQQVVANGSLARAARAHASWMFSTKTMSHQGDGGSMPHQRARSSGYRGYPLGECVLMGSRGGVHAIDIWWTSPPHKAILMDPGAREIGIGWVNGWATAMTGR